MKGATVELKPNRRRHRAEVLEQVRTHGGFSVFWATETQYRAMAIMDLEARGAILRKRGDLRDRFPWCVYEIGGGKP